MLSKCFDHATPAQMVVKVFCGHPVEPSHSLFQPRMEGVRILDMVDAGDDSDPLVQIHRPMGHLHLPSRQGDRAFPSPVRAKDHIPSQEGSPHGFDLPMGVLSDESRRKSIPNDPGPQEPEHALGRTPVLLPGHPVF